MKSGSTTDRLVPDKWPGRKTQTARSTRLSRVAAGLLVGAAVFGVACQANSDTFNPVGLIPGLTAENEIELTEVDPSPSSDDMLWDRAYSIEGIDRIDVGRAGPGFLDAAHRDPGEDLRCSGANGSYGCGRPGDDPQPDVSGFTGGGPGVLAWTWNNVPVQAAAVVFTEPDGRVTWQRPADQFVMFLNAVNSDCGCQMDAFDVDGNLIISTHVED